MASRVIWGFINFFVGLIGVLVLASAFDLSLGQTVGIAFVWWSLLND